MWSICNSENPALPSLFHFSTLDEFVGTSSDAGSAAQADVDAKVCLVQAAHAQKVTVGEEVAEAPEATLTAAQDANGVVPDEAIITLADK